LLTVTLPTHLLAFITERVARGRFGSVDQAVGRALSLLEERERMRDTVIDEIRQEIELGIQQAEAGNVRDGEEVFRALRAKRRMG
jgi:putative addiction module CopG family antidote